MQNASNVQRRSCTVVRKLVVRADIAGPSLLDRGWVRGLAELQGGNPVTSEPGPGHERIDDFDNEQLRDELHAPSEEMTRPALSGLALEPDRDVDVRSQGVALFVPG